MKRVGCLLDRRDFLESAIQSALFMTAALGTGKQARAAMDSIANPNQRYLINIHFRGGMDTIWFHNYFPVDPSDPLRLYRERFQGVSGMTYIPHPNVDQHFLGLGAIAAFGSHLADYFKNDILIWKGLSYNGSHDVGNHIINCGQTSSYAGSFSAILAKSFAENEGGPLPLQYVQTCATPEDLRSSYGLLKGAAVPTNIPTSDAFRNMVLPAGSDAPDSNRRALLTKLVSDLSSEASNGGFRLRQSRTIFDSFLSFFKSMQFLFSSNLSTDTTFGAIQQEYFGAARSAFGQIFSSTGPYFQYNYVCPYASDTGASNSNLRLNGGGANTLYGFSQSYWATYQLVDFLAWEFAFAEYLIRNGLTRVVDIGGASNIPALGFGIGSITVDGHNENVDDLACGLYRMSMFCKMIERLKAAPVRDASGNPTGATFFDRTTIFLATEFDRSLTMKIGNGVQTYGTDHGSNASFLLAGGNVHGGKVIGAPPFQGAQPINTNGDLDPSGAVCYTESVLPSILNLFGYSPPAEQVTGAPTITGIKKA